MSIRTISQLPILNINDIIQEISSNENFRDSLVEISWNVEDGKYNSMGMKLGGYYDYVYYNILSGGKDNKTVFNTSVDFINLVRMYGGLELSGNLFVNKDMDDDDASQYTSYIKTGNNTLCAVGKNEFSAPQTNIRTDQLQIFNLDGDQIVNIEDGNGIQITSDFEINGNGRIDGDITCNGLTAIDGISSGGDIHGEDFYGDNFYGVALCARWADLAETYDSDRIYENGTLVKFGGDREITIADSEAHAVITTSPGFVLNGTGRGQQIALVGRTPVKTIGPINKFDKIYACPFKNGVAATKKYIMENPNGLTTGNPIGIALASDEKEEEKLVECVVRMSF